MAMSCAIEFVKLCDMFVLCAVDIMELCENCVVNCDGKEASCKVH
jgi:hypothetical protein